MSKGKVYAAYSSITEGNKVGGKILWRQVIFGLNEEEATRLHFFGDTVVAQRKTESATIKAFKKEGGLDLCWKKNPEGNYCYMQKQTRSQ